MTMASTTGASTKELMRRAGHSSPAAALRYQHATEDRDKATANALNEMIRGDVIPISTAKSQEASRPQRAQGSEGTRHTSSDQGKAPGERLELST
jgi:hypothetical protein